MLSNNLILKNKIIYNLLINIRLKNKRINLGKTYFEKIYIIIISNAKANVISFTK